jgi:hypothetical protein
VLFEGVYKWASVGGGHMNIKNKSDF